MTSLVVEKIVSWNLVTVSAPTPSSLVLESWVVMHQIEVRLHHIGQVNVFLENNSLGTTACLGVLLI